MKSVEKITQNTLIIKKSQFITTLIPCNDEEDIDKYIKEYSKEDATHNCVAYIVNHKEKANDDGEPSGTAGLPMLNVLLRQELENIIVIVTRYFGGIKLGAGGLTRAYTNSVAEALKEANIIEKKLVKKYKIDIDYHYSKKITHIINSRNIKLVDTIYDDKVHYIIFLNDESFLNELQDITSNSFTYKEIGEEYI